MVIKGLPSEIQQEIDDINILKANFLNWQPGVVLENNIHLIIFLSTLALSIIFLAVGIIKKKTKVN